ncbi:carboxypeptidase PM20D1 [Leifsonia sp. 98AMF]|uniref:M20/M25/M40 family metallo-hydrolase n=1 Tax=unclassified Leifsonia TaxID=2663824 RepID=UPI00087CB535|nr:MULTISPECIES: M20/M25/M40 family metallo-hydrolase [unclassified Leifsonia]SDH25344.1 carboxypeptidase PM20D1 [Leifsonia sp. 197AMF]SDJ13067.1 carboxypeptidase PM20D1 [Leifsonia sp. 466MF]SDJ55985.1 carboxypeptidase PM20D1 [Leifsonia sp. 157MF]SDN34646.1 carboxypeptidase PM20D1 [Leifsonia sp. 509MF]SEM87199.1 carboxypeptidase PM20D1 [Leifsonia sp. 467MF]
MTAEALDRFRALLRIPTMSRNAVEETDWAVFDEFVATLPQLYPAMHSALEQERHGHSLLYRWRGRSDEAPTVLMAHYDVVPATAEGWTHPPFAAELTGSGEQQVLWGRGAIDDKGALVAILEAVEALVQDGFQPANDVYLSFGHDEETVGSGARAIVSVLAGRGIRPALVLDEGGAVVERIFPGVSKPIAVIGVSEKGITSVRLTVEQNGGHASTPPKTTATVRLARAITRLNDRPFPARLTETNLRMVETLGAHATGPLRAVFTRARRLQPALRVVFGRLSDETRAIVRTTTAVTQLRGSLAANALPETAEAVVNTRIAVGSSVAETLDHIRRAIRDDAVRVEAVDASEPSPVSPADGPEWDRLATAIGAVHPHAVVTPYIMLGASDSRHFTGICDAVYRFTPFELSAEERGALHARDERIHVATWRRGIAVYAHLLRAS